MRTTALALVTSFVLACGGKAATTAPASPASTGDEPAEAATPGTSGYPGVDWGASADELKAAFPRAAPGTNNLSITGNHAGKPGVTTFELQDGKLSRISVSFDDEYPSMEECAKGWSELRTTLDGTLGPSAGENLAAYWDSATYNIVLSCDPGEADQGVLSMSYGPPQD